jgi:DNA polymerase-3 subunit delta
MPVRSRKDLNQDLKKGTVEPVYFLFGPESYLRDEAARAIANEALRETLLREFNDSVFSLRDGDARSAIAAAEQLPMMSPRRVVVVTDFSKLNETNEEILLKYIERPVESSVVIFVSDDIDKRKKLAKKLMQGAAFEFPLLNTGELLAWARTHLHEIKATAEPQVISRVVELVGANVRTLSNELNKLSAAALPSSMITGELVEELVGRSRELMNWELTDHMIARNHRRALQTLKHLLDDGSPPVMLIGLIASTYRRIALAQGLLAGGATPKEIFRQVPMPPFKQNSFLQMLNRVDGRKLTRQIARIAQADLGIKTSKATPRMQVEMLVCELMI